MNDRKHQTISKAIEQTKKLGYDVYIPKDTEDNLLYFHYTDGKNVAYIQTNDFFHDRVRISTIHIGNRLSGGGFVILSEDEAILPEDITKKILDSGFIVAPSWAKHTPKKYTLKTWLEHSWSGQRAVLV